MATKQYPRALWRVIALTVVTFGLYYIVWLGLTWSEMKRELRDDTMHPAWHALTQCVLIYGWFRLHDHFETINDLAFQVGSPVRVNPSAVVKAVIAASVAGFLVNLLILDPLGNLLYVVAAIWFVARGQAALNAYWARKASQDDPTRDGG